ncbi:uncharacterized protein LOC121372656 isoform X1 [Gigantopelta aegis]|uniref:uncharacterized protein LOC121372656 isoform X1 n=1 Tax=Gigantopelta aegis TaxID=1735272 RepID=UPI001B8897CD|nr:uncharacterized protein LOC121372656 isoform X1 [Gigantopelta aegis]
MEFYPSELRFAQDSIADYFRGGRTLQDSFRSLLKVDSPETVLPKMDAMYYEGKFFVTDGNRRLYLLKLLESEGLVTGKVSVNLTSFNGFKYTTDNDGTSVRVRRQRNMEQILKGILREYSHLHRKRTVSQVKSSFYGIDQGSISSNSSYNRQTIQSNMFANPPSIRRVTEARTQQPYSFSRASSTGSVSSNSSYNRPKSAMSKASTRSQYGHQSIQSNQFYNPPSIRGVAGARTPQPYSSSSGSSAHAFHGTNVVGSSSPDVYLEQDSRENTTHVNVVHSSMRSKPARLETRRESSSCSSAHAFHGTNVVGSSSPDVYLEQDSRENTTHVNVVHSSMRSKPARLETRRESSSCSSAHAFHGTNVVGSSSPDVYLEQDSRENTTHDTRSSVNVVHPSMRSKPARRETGIESSSCCTCTIL